MTTLSIGKVTYDITVPVDEFPAENSKVLLKEKLQGSGGGASNVAYLLGKWNADVQFAGVVGYDDLGSSVKKELDSVGVHTGFLETNYERKTTSTYIIVNKKTTSRTQMIIEPEVFHLRKYEFDFTPEIIYSDGYEYSATQTAFNKYPNAITVLGAGINAADEKEVLALAKYAKYVIMSIDLAVKVSKITGNVNEASTLLALYKDLKEKFPNNEIIVTLHSFGVLYMVNNEIKVMPTIQVQEVDRTGAGDIFDGAFVYGLSKGYDMERCLRIANIAGGLSTTKYGAKASIPILSDVIHAYEEKFGSLSVPQQGGVQPQVGVSSVSQTPESLQMQTAQTIPPVVNTNVQTQVESLQSQGPQV